MHTPFFIWCFKFIILLFLLLPAQTVFGQRPKKNTGNTPPVAFSDTVLKRPSPGTLVFTGNCLRGFAEVTVQLNLSDTFIQPAWVYVYYMPDTNTLPDTVMPDTPTLVNTLRYIDLAKNNNILFTEYKGNYYIKTVAGEANTLVYSPPSNTIYIGYCSIIEFPSVFYRTAQGKYHPGPLINVQVQEFDIFDRVGNTVYSHKNNDINWDGSNSQRQPCAEGVYYYHCVYKDLSEGDGVVKTLSGMIELKN